MAACAGAVLVGAGPAAASNAPVITRGGDQGTIPDDFIFDVCGITAEVTFSERWVDKQFPDGSRTLKVVRTYTSSDPRVPTEKAAATSFIAPDGSRVLVGKAIHLFRADGGVLLLDAGRISFDPAGEVVDVSGPHPFLDMDPVELYCP